jgi:alpha-ketoglutarate-dependent taurine dioxygenase
MALNMQPLSDKFGVAITGIDLSKDVDQNLFNEIVDVFVKKQVLVFRDQHIDFQHQVAFSRRFGRSKCCMLKIVQDVQVVQPLRSVQIVERTERFKTLHGF